MNPALLSRLTPTCRFRGCQQLPMHDLKMLAKVPVHGLLPEIDDEEMVEMEIEVPVCAFHKQWLMQSVTENLWLQGPLVTDRKRGV